MPALPASAARRSCVPPEPSLTPAPLIACPPCPALLQGLRTFEQVDEVEALQEGRKKKGACAAHCACSRLPNWTGWC